MKCGTARKGDGRQPAAATEERRGRQQHQQQQRQQRWGTSFVHINHTASEDRGLEG